jgi:hypothetical protein
LSYFISPPLSLSFTLPLSPYTGNSIVAATIFSKEEVLMPPPTVRILSATFFSPVAGTIYFRRISRDGRETAVFGKLYHVSDSATTMGHNFAIKNLEVFKFLRVASIGGACKLEAFKMFSSFEDTVN